MGEKMLKSHEILLKFRHDPRYSFSGISVSYIDRGAPGDESTATGDQICSLGPYFMEILSAERVKPIPYHRIKKICYNTEILWQR